MRTFPGDIDLVDLQCIAFNDLKSVPEFEVKLCEGWDAAWIALDGNHSSTGVKERPRQAARTWSNFIDRFPFKRSGDSSNAGEELPVEDEILPQ